MMCKNLRLDTIRRLICDDPGTLMKIHGRHTRRPQTKPSKATETEAKSSGLVHVDKQDTGLDSASRCTEKPPVIPTRTRIPPDREYKRMDSNDLAFIFVSEKNMEKKTAVLHLCRSPGKGQDWDGDSRRLFSLGKRLIPFRNGP